MPTTRAILLSTAVSLPPHLQAVLETAPANVDRRAGAELVTRHLFPISHRSLEAWSLPMQHVNGKAIVSTRTLLEAAYAKLSAAPVIMAGRRATRDTDQIHDQHAI
jgi:hypothetical protein